MNSFDISEIPASLGIGVIVIIGVVTVGTIIYRKIMKKISLTINNFHFEDSTTHLNISIKNLKNVRVMAVYHFEYKDFISKKFSITLGGNQTKTVNISADEYPTDPSLVDDKLFKLVVDNVKVV